LASPLLLDLFTFTSCDYTQIHLYDSRHTTASKAMDSAIAFKHGDDSPSPETKNWITGIILGVLAIILAASGVVIAYKQLRRTKRPDDL
jgi:hypothetical protein